MWYTWQLWRSLGWRPITRRTIELCVFLMHSCLQMSFVTSLARLDFKKKSVHFISLKWGCVTSKSDDYVTLFWPSCLWYRKCSCWYNYAPIEFSLLKTIQHLMVTWIVCTEAEYFVYKCVDSKAEYRFFFL